MDSDVACANINKLKDYFDFQKYFIIASSSERPSINIESLNLKATLLKNKHKIPSVYSAMVFTKTRENYDISFTVETLVFLWQRFSGSPYTKKLKKLTSTSTRPLASRFPTQFSFHLLDVHMILRIRERYRGRGAEPSPVAGRIVGEVPRGWSQQLSGGIQVCKVASWLAAPWPWQ